MYDDEKTLKQHYKDWVKLVESIKYHPDDVKKEQHDYRIKIIQNLIDKYKLDVN